MAAKRAAAFMRAAESTSVGQESLDQIHDDVRRLAVSYQQVPLPEILGDLLDAQEDVFALLEHGRVKPLQARDLYLMAAITSGMLAKASHDAGDVHAALTQARTAYVCADNADHQAMRAWVRGLQSLVTYWAGRTEDAARYAALGSAILPEGAGTTGVWLSCLSARAHAILRDGEAARAAIDRADRLRERVDLDDLDGIGGLFTFGEARQIYYAGEALVHLDPADQRAEATARASVQAYRAVEREEWAFGDEAGAATNLALAQIAGGELDGAVEAVRPVLDLPAVNRNFGIVQSMRRVRAALLDTEQRRSPVASQLRDEIEDYEVTTTAAILR
ncbi:XRE family transcriptional regulator [Streptomyces sp. SID3343]|nr:XRE family transcriptional regulator [Streptomyces sp. SID3343]